MVTTDTKEDRKIIFPDEDAITLRQAVPWRELFPGLPTVEVARRDEDPVFWLRTNDDGSWYHVAGYSIDAAPGVIPSDGEFTRGSSTRFWGLMVEYWYKSMRWTEIDDGFLDRQGPGYLSLGLDRSWQPKRLSELLRTIPTTSSSRYAR